MSLSDERLGANTCAWHLKGRMRAQRQERLSHPQWTWTSPSGRELRASYGRRPIAYYVWFYEVVNTRTGRVIWSDNVASYDVALRSLLTAVAVIREAYAMSVKWKHA